MNRTDGVVIALVTNVEDPDRQGRVKLRYPWMDPLSQTDWVRNATAMAGKGRGTFLMPEVNDEALVAFEHGDVRFPYVIGYLWNGRDEPAADNVRVRRIQSTNGHRISFYDSTPSNGSKGALVIEDAHGNLVVMSAGRTVIRSRGILDLQGSIVRVNNRIVSPNGNPI